MNSGDSTQSPSAEQCAALRAKALDLLARREHSQAELERKLQQKLPSPLNDNLLPTVLESLVAQGLLSDERFTEAYVNMRARKGYGPQRIALELSERGIGAELAACYLQGREDWEANLSDAWRKKFGRFPTSYAEKAKQMRCLIYRGFSSGTVSHFLDQTVNEEHGPQ